MLKRFIATGVTCIWLLAGVAGSVTHAGALQHDKPTLQKSSLADADRNQHMQNTLAAAVRHELLTLRTTTSSIGWKRRYSQAVGLSFEVKWSVLQHQMMLKTACAESKAFPEYLMRFKCCLCPRGIANFGSRFIGPFTIGIRPYFDMPCG